MRIGELAARVGVGTSTLRAWERRYGVLEPERTAGGHRIYTLRDVARVRALLARVEAGVSIAQAATELTGSGGGTQAGTVELSEDLWRAIDSFNGPAIEAALREAMDASGVVATLDDLLAPLFRRLGAEWRATPRNIAREHFATGVVRSLLLQHLPNRTTGARVCLGFCPQGENHDLGLVMAAAALADVGWHPIVLGAHTPWASVEALVDELSPRLIVIGAQLRRPALRLVEMWPRRRRRGRVLIGGAGFERTDAARIRATFHNGPFAHLGQAAGLAVAE